jgi:hypothetical protein
MKVLGLIVSIIVLSHSAFAQIGTWNGGPRLFSYQGEMREKSGKLIADGVHLVNIELYDGSSGGGTAIYMEQQMVTFHNGVFDLFVGQENSPTNQLPEQVTFDRPYWMQITFEPGGMNEQKFPRTLIESAPYALNAERVNGIKASAGVIEGNIFPLPMVNGKIDPAILPQSPSSVRNIDAVGPDNSGTLNIVGASGITVTPDPNTHTITLTGPNLAPGVDATMVATGTTAERPATPAAGMIRFNTTTKKFEGFDGTNWVDLN